MKPKDIFTLAVRLLALVFFYHGVQSLVVLASGSVLLFLYVGFQFVVAWWLIGGASLLVNRAYPTDSPAPPGNPAQSDKVA